MAARIEKELKKEISEFSRYAKLTERLVAVLFVFTIILIAVNIPAMLVEIKMLTAIELEAVFLCELLLVIVIVYVAKKMLSYD